MHEVDLLFECIRAVFKKFLDRHS